MQYLFLLSISPVQSFIQQARKTQDLRAGSQMLSDLIEVAITSLKESEKIDTFSLVFPHENVVSKPNRFLAVLETNLEIQILGEHTRDKILEYFLDQSRSELQKTGFFDNCIDQLKNFFKIYWVAIEFHENQPYSEQNKTIEELMGAVKANRPFAQLAEQGRKCSLNGELNVKFYRKTLEETASGTDEKVQNKLFHHDALMVDYQDESKITSKDLQAGEGLSAISYLKRVWQIKEMDEKGKRRKLDSFPSVSEIALINVLARLAQKNDLASCINIIKYINDQFFYEENLTEKVFKRVLDRAGKKNIADLQTINQFHYKVAQAAKKEELKLSKYYAILVFDADNMGQKLTDKPLKYQRSLSECFGQFALKASHYVDGIGSDCVEKGKTVYAGGDDYLGFLNLDFLLDTLIWLRMEFDNLINKAMEDKKFENPELTFSAGVAIAHYKTPLSEVVNKAKFSEKVAKNKYKDIIPPKNAFCLTVIKRSGETHNTTWKWSYDNNISSTPELLREILEIMVKQEISSTFIKNIQLEFRRLTDESGQIRGDLREPLKFELIRLMKRSMNPLVETMRVVDLGERLYHLFLKDKTLNLFNFIQLLNILDFLHRQVNIVAKPENAQNV